MDNSTNQARAQDTPQDKRQDSRTTQGHRSGSMPELAPQERNVLGGHGRAALNAGLSLIPLNGEKLPAVWLLPIKTDDQGQPVLGRGGKPKHTWKPYQTQRATEQELRTWMTKPGVQGLAVVCGAISGGLLVLDFDVRRFFDVWTELIGGLQEGILVQMTGSGGVQVKVRCPNPGKAQKLAWVVDLTEETGRTIAIETRGEGNYAVLAGSLHPSGNRYQLLQGDYSNILFIDQETADRWLRAARELDEAPHARPDPQRAQAQGTREHETRATRPESSGSVIAAYNQAHDIYEVLRENGYHRDGDDCIRPGGERPTVTIQANKDKVLCSFHHNTNDQLCDGYWHTPFSVFCFFEHGNDVKAAVRDAARQLGLDWRSETRQHNEQRQDGQQPAQGEAPDAEDAAEEEGKPRFSQVKELLSIAHEHATLFHTPEGECYARVELRGHYETLSIGEKGGLFKNWLIKAYMDAIGTPPNATALSQAVSSLRSIALFGEGGQKPVKRRVYTRLAYVGQKIYLDLADEDRHVLEIDASGWHQVEDPPVCFRRPAGVEPLPMPRAGGSLEDLRQFVNVSSDVDWMLLESWLIGTMQPFGPYAHLAVYAPQGAAKTSAFWFIRQVIDPSSAFVSGAPKDEDALDINAKNASVIALDNLSHLPQWLSDALCRLSTGTGGRKRTLYTDDEELLFNSRRPVMMNGITELASRGDLLQRTITITLAPITEGRLTERKLKAEFEEARPSILGGLLDIVSAALRNLGTAPEENLPRMADFAQWILAAEPVLGWEPGVWLDAYRLNQEKSASVPLEASPLREPIKKLLEQKAGEWTGLTSDLLTELTMRAKPQELRSQSWPVDAARLSSELRRLQPALLAVKIGTIFKRETDGAHIWLWDMNKDDAPFNVGNVANVAVSPLFSLAQKEKGERIKEEIPEERGKVPETATLATLPTLQSAFKVSPAIVNQDGPVSDGTAARQSAPLSEFDALSESKKLLAVQLLQVHMQPASAPAPDELSACLTEILVWARQRSYRHATLTGMLFGGDDTEQSWQSDLMSVLIPGSEGILLKARGMVAETRQIDAAEEAEHPPWWATDDPCTVCQAPAVDYIGNEGTPYCAAHSPRTKLSDDDDMETVPRLPTPPKLTIVQAEQASAEATNLESTPAMPRYNPAWQQLRPRERIAAMAAALGHRAVTTSQGEAYGGSPGLWGVHLPVTALSYIMTALEAEFER